MHTSYGPTPSPQPYRAPGHPCDEPCLAAASTVADCTCSCGGRHHGAQRATHGPDTAAVADRRTRQLTRAMSQAPTDEPW